MNNQNSLYFMGIGGTLMGSLAILATQAGYSVKGFDRVIYPPMSDQLANANIEIFDHFDPAHLQPPPNLVIVGNANLPRGSEPLEYVLSQKLPYTSGADWLGSKILQGRRVIAVAGTHGKTTTTAMIAWILSSAGLEPGYLIGGVPQNFNLTAKLGSGEFFVVEADEYDTSYFDRRAKFLHYRPDILVVTSLEFDHADIFDDLDAIKYQFQHLFRLVPERGHIIVPHNHEHIDDVLNRGCWTPLTRFNTSIRPNVETEFTATNIAADGSSFDIETHKLGTVGRVSWNLFGAHNVANGLGALIASYHAGVELDEAIDYLNAFQGVKRRMEVFAQTESTTFYSDFAHHPTAIATTLEGVRHRVGLDHVLAVIEPGTHTMSLGTLRGELKDCCRVADEVIWFQSPRVRWDLTELSKDTTIPTKVAKDVDCLVAELCGQRDQRTHVVIMSNGAFAGIYKKISDQICSDNSETLQPSSDFCMD